MGSLEWPDGGGPPAGSRPCFTAPVPYTCPMERYRNIGPLYAVRLGDLREWHVIVGTCFRCGHTGAVPLARLLRRRSSDHRLVDLQTKLWLPAMWQPSDEHRERDQEAEGLSRATLLHPHFPS
jgi:hypothetical protein